MALDNFRTIELIWDKANKSIIKTIKTASSDTTGRYLSVKILDGGQEVTLNNAKLQLYWEHPNFNTSGTDDFNTVNNGGLFKMTFSKEMLTNIGELTAHLVLTLPDGKITSDGFTIEVIKGADGGVVVPTNGNGLVEQIDGKIDKGNVTLNDLTQEVKLAMTGGAVAVVGENSVGTENIKDSAVIPDKTTFLNRKSPNLLDKSIATIDVAVSTGNGNVVSAAGYHTSDFIRVDGGKTYSSKYGGNKAIYDENKEFISGTTATSIAIPSQGYWIRITYSSSKFDEMLVEGSSIPDNYIEFDGRYTLNDQVHIDKTIEQDDLKSKIVSPDKTTFLSKDTSKINLLNPDTLTFDQAVSNVNGNLTSYVGYVTSDFIPVSPNSTIITSDARNKAVYDENKNFISGDNSQKITTPNNGAFVRVSFPASRLNLEMVIESDVFPTEKYEYGAPIKYKFSEDIKLEVESSDSLSDFEKSWEGKKTVHLGDSITQLAANGTKKYYQYLQEWLPLGSVKQYGISTSTISSGNGAYEPFVDRYHLMDDDADLVTVFGGTNDWGRTETTKGEFYGTGGTVNKDATTMYGACHTLFEGLVNKYTNRGAEIVILLPIQRVGQDVPNATTGMTLKEYTEVIKEVAHFYSLPVLDLYNEGGMNPNLAEVKTKYFADNTHPNDVGQERIAHRLLGYLRAIY